MSSQHLSDEAIAAFADGVLSTHARERATRHAASCAECAHAVTVQREAVWALRAAPAPALPIGLMDRLRSVPMTTSIENVPSAMSSDGSVLFSAFGSMTAAAAFVPADAGVSHSTHRMRPIVLTVAAVAMTGALAVGSGVASGGTAQPTRSGPGSAGFVQEPVAPAPSAPLLIPANVRVRIGS